MSKCFRDDDDGFSDGFSEQVYMLLSKRFPRVAVWSNSDAIELPSDDDIQDCKLTLLQVTSLSKPILQVVKSSRLSCTSLSPIFRFLLSYIRYV